MGVTSPPIGLDFRNRTCHEHLLLIFKPTEILCKKGHVKILFFVCVNIDLARGGSSRISLPTSEAHTIKKMFFDIGVPQKTAMLVGTSTGIDPMCQRDDVAYAAVVAAFWFSTPFQQHCQPWLYLL